MTKVESVKLTEIVEKIEDSKRIGKVPLFLDKSGNVDTFLVYQHTQTVEAKRYLMETINGQKSREDILEDLRKALVG